MANYFSNNEGNEISGGEFIASADDSKVKYFSDCKNMKITGGRYGTLGRTDATQSSGGTSSNATHSSTFSQDGSDGDSHPSRQSTGKREAHQQDSMSPYDRSGERKGSGGSILATPHQVANDPESYDTIQATQSPHASQNVASSALRTNTVPSSNKGNGGSSQHAHVVRSDTGGSSSKFQTNAHVALSSASRTNTSPPSSKGNDNTTQYVNPPPPPLPPKPEEFRKGKSHTGPASTGGKSDLNCGGSYPNPPPPPPITTGTGHTGYPSPGPSPPRGQIFDQSPLGSPEVLSQGYQFSPVSPPFPHTPHRQTLPFHPNAPQMGYPSPEISPPGYSGSYHPPRGGIGQRGYAQGGYPPQALPTSPTTNIRRRPGNAPPVDILQWSKSDSPNTSSFGDSRIASTMSRSTTMPTPDFYRDHGLAPTTTNPTSPPPYGGQYHPPLHDGSHYDASTDHTDHGRPPSWYPMPAPQSHNYPGNYYSGPPAPSQEQAPSFPIPQTRSNTFGR